MTFCEWCGEASHETSCQRDLRGVAWWVCSTCEFWFQEGAEWYMSMHVSEMPFTITRRVTALTDIDTESDEIPI